MNGAVNWGGTVLLGIAASLIFRPVFVSRYMVPALGSLWLGYAILLGRLEGRARYLWLAAAAVLLCAALLNVRSFIAAELRMKNAFEKLEARLETIEEDARFVASVGDVTLEQANRAIQSRISLDDLTIVVVGTHDAIGDEVRQAIPGLGEARIVPFDAD